mmetsp:Transcript_18802/g.37921  ORF Transcript_18802/g.37921 Transcript_18802/m.37921 type:complete len:127 (+) Transcript_18802:1782-2162(+)
MVFLRDAHAGAAAGHAVGERVAAVQRGVLDCGLRLHARQVGDALGGAAMARCLLRELLAAHDTEFAFGLGRLLRHILRLRRRLLLLRVLLEHFHRRHRRKLLEGKGVGLPVAFEEKVRVVPDIPPP